MNDLQEIAEDFRERATNGRSILAGVDTAHRWGIHGLVYTHSSASHALQSNDGESCQRRSARS